jgi:hypothetical protein
MITAFLKLMAGQSVIIQPFSNILIGGGKKILKKRKTLKKTNMRKNLSRKKATKRKNLNKKKSLYKRTNKKSNKRKCNCDTSRSYNGKEPSPKGLGFCAHCSPENITMKGLDGDLWKNEKYSKGKRWVKVRIDMN